MTAMVRQYLVTALWSSTDDAGNPLDDTHDISALSPECVQQAERDVAAFVTKAGALLDGLDLTDVAHDFWLTRNGHGAGFWDGDYEEEVGAKLTEIAESFGTVDLYVGDDGVVHAA
jgi:hypothetical protein